MRSTANARVVWLVLSACLVLLPALAHAQRQKVFITGKASSKTAEGAVMALKNLTAERLDREYRCSRSTTDSDVGAMLGHAKDRAMLGNSDEASLAEIGGAMAARYLVSWDVVQVGGTMTMTGVAIDVARGKTIARQSAVSKDERGAFEVAETLVDQMVADLIAKLPDCYENEWVGTVTLKKVVARENTLTEPHLIHENVKKKTTVTSQSSMEAEVEVRGAKRPARAEITYTEDNETRVSGDGTVKCGPASITSNDPGQLQPRVVRWQWTDVQKVVGKAEAKAVEAVASVEVNGGEFTISVTVPSIDGTAVRESTVKDTGLCGDPVNTNQKTSLSFSTGEEVGEASGTVDRATPDVLKGSTTQKVPSAAGVRETKTLTWNLKFVRAPSTEKVR